MIADATLYDLNPLYFTNSSLNPPEVDFLSLYTKLNDSELLRLAHSPDVFIHQCEMGVLSLSHAGSECQFLKARLCF